MQAGGKTKGLAQTVRVCIRWHAVSRHAAVAALQGQFYGFHGAHVFDILQTETVCHHVQHLPLVIHRNRCFSGFFGCRGFFRSRRFLAFDRRVIGGVADFALGMYAGETTGTQPCLQFIGAGVGGQLDRKGNHPARIGVAQCHELFENAVCAVVLHGLRGLLVKQLTGAGEQQFQMVVQLGHGADGGTRTAHRVGLIDGNCRRYAFDFVYRRSVHAV